MRVNNFPIFFRLTTLSFLLMLTLFFPDSSIPFFWFPKLFFFKLNFYECFLLSLNFSCWFSEEERKELRHRSSKVRKKSLLKNKLSCRIFYLMILIPFSKTLWNYLSSWIIRQYSRQQSYSNPSLSLFFSSSWILHIL